jgi:hypothetical protein
VFSSAGEYIPMTPIEFWLTNRTCERHCPTAPVWHHDCSTHRAVGRDNMIYPTYSMLYKESHLARLTSCFRQRLKMISLASRFKRSAVRHKSRYQESIAHSLSRSTSWNAAPAWYISYEYVHRLARKVAACPRSKNVSSTGGQAVTPTRFIRT